MALIGARDEQYLYLPFRPWYADRHMHAVRLSVTEVERVVACPNSTRHDGGRYVEQARAYQRSSGDPPGTQVWYNGWCLP